MRRVIGSALGMIGLVLTAACAGMGPRPAPTLPDARLTPGDTLPVTARDICTPGYAKKVRNVPEAVKRQVYALYGIKSHKPGEYEVDHLISLELGGSNSVRNLWPQSYQTKPWNARVKDVLENELHRQVCSGKVDLKVAQQDIARNWIDAYRKYMGSAAPMQKGSKRRAAQMGPRTRAPREQGTASATGPGMVWVNTRSGRYFMPGSRYYGHTKEGRYMSEADAKRAGYKQVRD